MNYNIEEIMSILPHSYPFLLIDRIVDGEAGKWTRAIKNVTVNEPYFQGHFPGRPIMPGVLLVEAMAQAGAVAVLAEEGDSLALFTGIQKAKFKRQVVPGDRLEIVTELVERKLNIGFAEGKVSVDGKLAASAEFSFAIVKRASN